APAPITSMRIKISLSPILVPVRQPAEACDKTGGLPSREQLRWLVWRYALGGGEIPSATARGRIRADQQMRSTNVEALPLTVLISTLSSNLRSPVPMFIVLTCTSQAR